MDCANYGQTLTMKKPPLAYGYDTSTQQSAYPAGSEPDGNEQLMYTMGKYQDRSLPRPPDDVPSRQQPDGLESPAVTENNSTPILIDVDA